MQQLGWSCLRYGIRWSNTPYYKRFSIVTTSSGHTVTDHQTHEQERVTTFAAAKAWAGIRVGETVVRHGA